MLRAGPGPAPGPARARALGGLGRSLRARRRRHPLGAACDFLCSARRLRGSEGPLRRRPDGRPLARRDHRARRRRRASTRPTACASSPPAAGSCRRRPSRPATAACWPSACASARPWRRSPSRPGCRSPTTTRPTSSCCRARSAALDEAEELLRERKVRAKRLPVAGAFHSPLMEPAVAPFRELVEQVEFREPRVPVLSCVTAAPFDDVRRAARRRRSPTRCAGPA